MQRLDWLRIWQASYQVGVGRLATSQKLAVAANAARFSCLGSICRGHKRADTPQCQTQCQTRFVRVDALETVREMQRTGEQSLVARL